MSTVCLGLEKHQSLTYSYYLSIHHDLLLIWSLSLFIQCHLTSSLAPVIINTTIRGCLTIEVTCSIFFFVFRGQFLCSSSLITE